MILQSFENIYPLYFYTYRFVWAKMIVHAFMIELDQCREREREYKRLLPPPSSSLP